MLGKIPSNRLTENEKAWYYPVGVGAMHPPTIAQRFIDTVRRTDTETTTAILSYLFVRLFCCPGASIYREDL